ncbi:MAG: cytochrome c3 family protein [Candidatus Marinimicrobia bacterium]|nr:cytochrome c3 family protein [Candidatus Neomarinimicrobiota bacterium]
MTQIFPKWSNKVPLFLAGGLVVVLAGIVGFFWYFGSPYYTDVGYRPEQPIPYSHKLHAGDMGMDCRYCHTGVEVTATAGVPPTQTCMNCHNMVKTESDSIKPIIQSWNTGIPIEWVRIHKTPDFAYFDHSIHINRNIGCESCHGRIDQMETVMLSKPLSMKWCLDCHRDPTSHIRPDGNVTAMGWTPGEGQSDWATEFISTNKINPPTDCSGCHR